MAEPSADQFWIPKLYNGHDKSFFFVEYTRFSWRPSSNNAGLTTFPQPIQDWQFPAGAWCTADHQYGSANLLICSVGQCTREKFTIRWTPQPWSCRMLMEWERQPIRCGTHFQITRSIRRSSAKRRQLCCRISRRPQTIKSRTTTSAFNPRRTMRTGLWCGSTTPSTQSTTFLAASSLAITTSPTTAV